jgi:hypothetical protein
MKIDTDVLTEAINEHKDAKFQQDFRDWLVYTAPPELQAIFKSYAEKMEQKGEEQRRSFATHSFIVFGMVLIAVGIVVVNVLMTPICK